MLDYIVLGVIIYFIVGLGITISTCKESIVEDFANGEWFQSITAIVGTTLLYLPMMLISLYNGEFKGGK